MDQVSYLESLTTQERDKLINLVQSQNEENSSSLVEQLKEHLKREINIRKDVQDHLVHLKKQIQDERQQSEQEQAKLIVANQKFQQQIEQLQKENQQLKRQISYNDKAFTENQQKNENLTKNLNSLRQLVQRLLNEQTSSKRKEVREKRLFENLEAEQLLFDSEPPSHFSLNKNEVPIQREM